MGYGDGGYAGGPLNFEGIQAFRVRIWVAYSGSDVHSVTGAADQAGLIAAAPADPK
jgi:hypothetical protein